MSCAPKLSQSASARLVIICSGGRFFLLGSLHGGEKRVIADLDGVNVQDTLRRGDETEVDDMSNGPTVSNGQGNCVAGVRTNAPNKKKRSVAVTAARSHRPMNAQTRKTYTVQLTFMVGQSLSLTSVVISSGFPSMSFMEPKKTEVKMGAQKI